MLWQPPVREISLTRGNNRDYVFTFEDMNSPLIPNIGGSPDQRQHDLYNFPVGTIFKFRAKDDQGTDIIKVGAYTPATKEVKISFIGADTATITRNKRVPYELDAVFPDGNRYTVLVGEVVIFATRNLNG